MSLCRYVPIFLRAGRVAVPSHPLSQELVEPTVQKMTVLASEALKIVGTLIGIEVL